MAEIRILIEGYAQKLENGFRASSTTCLVITEGKRILTDLVATEKSYWMH